MSVNRTYRTATITAGLREEFAVLHRQTQAFLGAGSCPPPGWRPSGLPSANPVAVLVTHLAGANAFWVGELAGGRPSGRVRQAEFAADVAERATLASLVERVQTSDRLVEEVLAELDDAKLLEPVARGEPAAGATSHPLLQSGEVPTRLFCLLHALTHHAHHHGQLLWLGKLWESERTAS